MTDVAVDASTPGVPAAVLDLDWLPEVDPADVLGCGVRPGLGEAGWVAAGPRTESSRSPSSRR